MFQLVEMKSLGGTNFVRPDRVIVVQTSPTGSTVIVMEGGTTVNSSETTKVVAARVQAALLDEQPAALNGEGGHPRPAASYGAQPNST